MITQPRPLIRYAALSVLAVMATSMLVISEARNSGAAGNAPPRPPVVAEAKLPCCQNIVLGDSSNATLIATSPTVPAGSYLVHATVGVVMGPNSANAQNVICATAPTSVGGNDGIFGAAGNGATESGSGPAGVYGTATIEDTWTITTRDTIYLYCWAGIGGQGTYVSQALIALEKIGTLIGG